MILTGAGTDLLTLPPKVGREVSFFNFYWDTPVISVLSFLPERCSCFFTFKCMGLEGGEMRSPLGLCVGLAAVMPRVCLSTVFND